jgi:3-oxoacyl-[acyl-carrier-protein] synthase III
MLTPQIVTDPSGREIPRSASGRSRMGSLAGIKIAATGSYVPDQIVTNEDLAELGCDSEWIVARTGILERRKASDTQASSDLAWYAATDCLKNANLDPSDVDLLICATITPDFSLRVRLVCCKVDWVASPRHSISTQHVQVLWWA